jgi:HSP20 family molecular chaperone IbpA
MHKEKISMLSRYYSTTQPPIFSLFDPFKVFDESDNYKLNQRLDSIDEGGIKIELPGAKSSDLDVSVRGRTLKVTGKSRHGKEFSYVYTLKSVVDTEEITAKFQDGLLEVLLPKKKSEESVKIKIET